MDLIVAILLWTGIASSPESVNNTMIQQNQTVIEYYSHDEEFLEDYNSTRTADHIGMMDVDAGD